MTCCLMPSNHIWTIVDLQSVKSRVIHPRTISLEMLKISVSEILLQNYIFRITAIFPRVHWVKRPLYKNCCLISQGPTVIIRQMANILQILFSNSLWPSDGILQHRSESALAQVMACCLKTFHHICSEILRRNFGGKWLCYNLSGSISGDLSDLLINPANT